MVIAAADPRSTRKVHFNALERYMQAGGRVLILPQALQAMSKWEANHIRLNENGDVFIETTFRIGGKSIHDFFCTLTKAGSHQIIQSQDSLPLIWRRDNLLFLNGGLNTPLPSPLYHASGLSAIQDFVNNPIAKPDYTHCTTVLLPDETRFIKTSLAENLYEPMELEVLSNGDVLFIQRRGEILKYESATGLTKLLGRLKVHLGLENGLLGLACHPEFDQNKLIYLFYSDPNLPEHHVSQFRLTDAGIDTASEKIILKIPEQRQNACCHSAGSLYMTKEGVLYISTGDNTDSHHSNGYAPLDQRQGMYWNDSQRTSGNTNALNGKILRIIPHTNGSYSIPRDNLFELNDSLARPEIYVMGVRNPYRISVDEQRNFLIWGDVGPDAHAASAQNPNSYDEFNLATKAGNFGWPYFIAYNKAYSMYDFAADTHAKSQNPCPPAQQIHKQYRKTSLTPGHACLTVLPLRVLRSISANGHRRQIRYRRSGVLSKEIPYLFFV